MKNNYLAEKLKAVRESCGLSPEQLAKLTEGAVNKQMVYKYEKGENEPSYSKISAIAKALKIDPGVFFEEAIVRASSIFHLAGAGDPQLSSGEIVASLSLPASFIGSNIIPVMVKGSSMEPAMYDGAIVGVDTSDKHVESGKYYAIWIDDEGALIKRLSRERGRVFVESLNKNAHSFYVETEALQDHFILGKVKWWINQDTGK